MAYLTFGRHFLFLKTFPNQVCLRRLSLVINYLRQDVGPKV